LKRQAEHGWPMTDHRWIGQSGVARFFALLAGLLPMICSAGDWSAWLAPQGRGIGNPVTGEALPESVDLENVAWRGKVGIGFSTVAVADGRVFTMGHNGKPGPRGTGGVETVWCLDAENGDVVWKDEYPAPLLPNLHEGGPGATPVLADGVLFTVSKDGQARAYEAASGRQLWTCELMPVAGMRRPPEWGFSASPVVYGDWVIVEAGATIALDRNNGSVVWQSDKMTPAYGSPVVFQQAGRDWIAVLKTEGLVILDPNASGKTVAFHSWETSFQTNANTPMVIGDRLFISTGYDRGCTLLHFADGKLNPVYENQVMCNHMSNSVLIDGHLYGFDGTAHRGREVELVCMELETGTEKWRYKGLRYGTLIGAGSQVVVLSERGELLVGKASPEGWEPSHETQVLGGRCWTMPIWSGGRLYCRNSRGDLVVLNLAGER